MASTDLVLNYELTVWFSVCQKKKEGLNLQNSLKNSVILNTVNENENKIGEVSSLKTVSQLT